MKPFIYILILSCLVLLQAGCDQDIDYPYSGKDRIQFQCFRLNTSTQARTYSDSLTFSFGLTPDSIKVDTAEVVVEFLGKGSAQERTYYVSVVADSSTAVSGVHYKAIEKEQKFRPNSPTDTLLIVIYRENLSTDYNNPEVVRLDLQLEASDDFDIGLSQGIMKKIRMNNYLSEPAWWKPNFGKTLGFFHPKKWKYLMSLNALFRNQNTCSLTMNNEGRTYATSLSDYLERTPTYDDKTGFRIYIDRLVDPATEE